MQINLNVTEVVKSLGGHPRSDEAANLQLLANEIVIMRQKLAESDQQKGRLERELHNETESRSQAETRAEIAERTLGIIASRVESAQVEAVASGAPMRYISDSHEPRARTPLPSEDRGTSLRNIA